MTRREGDDVVVYEAGDTFDATDDELDAFGDRLERVEEASIEFNRQEDDVEDETPGGDGVESTLQEAGIDPDDYDALRSAATEYDDIDGRSDKETLRQELGERL